MLWCTIWYINIQNMSDSNLRTNLPTQITERTNELRSAVSEVEFTIYHQVWPRIIGPRVQLFPSDDVQVISSIAELELCEQQLATAKQALLQHYEQNIDLVIPLIKEVLFEQLPVSQFSYLADGFVSDVRADYVTKEGITLVELVRMIERNRRYVLQEQIHYTVEKESPAYEIVQKIVNELFQEKGKELAAYEALGIEEARLAERQEQFGPYAERTRYRQAQTEKLLLELQKSTYGIVTAVLAKIEISMPDNETFKYLVNWKVAEADINYELVAHANFVGFAGLSVVNQTLIVADLCLGELLQTVNQSARAVILQNINDEIVTKTLAELFSKIDNGTLSIVESKDLGTHVRTCLLTSL